MMRALLSTLLVVAAIAISPGVARAQADDKVYTSSAHRQFTYVANLLIRTSEKVSDDLYSFKPTPEVRSIAALLGHVVDDHFLMCKIAQGETFDKFTPEHEKKTSKKELVALMKESVAFCDAAFKKLNDTTGKEIVASFGTKQPKLTWLNSNTQHDWEHYGNLVTYMRLKNIVPPSSEPRSGSAQ
jgi:uncharacterized damage-inducible protein DinB